MSDSRQFIFVMIIAALFVSWLGWRGYVVMELNENIRSHEEIADYPYPFRVLRVEGGTAVMSTLRSPRIATEQALRELFPSLRGTSEDSAEMRRLEQEYARLQVRASQAVLASPRIHRVRWELDENWYYLNDMELRQGGLGNPALSPARGS
ncbi:hypothetical protein DES49_1099 [Halospina denitrificans]|uniref:Uncharacterized protein n=1 Tax=Halospina denitrificans TaxID=332522 RepID=A0A4R7JYK5_9GAMM|nr:hypothetical protein [Halospina denitrificans]TDT43285.1 hypothetical protein DES49_1099 [Halospina denitrificans]